MSLSGIVGIIGFTLRRTTVQIYSPPNQSASPARGKVEKRGKSMPERRQLGDATLDLLADECILTVLCELSDGPARASEIEARAPGVSHRTVTRCLQSLARAGFVAAVRAPLKSPGERCRPGRPQAPYALTELGRELLRGVARAAVRCEQAWRPSPEPYGAPGLWVLKLVGDHHTRALARALADAPLTPTELEVRLPDLARSTFRERLRTLRGAGVLVRDRHRGEARYALADGARRLAIVALRAALCECRRAAPADRALGGDLPGLLHMLAPVGRIPRGASGVCRWRLDAKTKPAVDIHLTATSGRIAALSTPPLTEPEAVSHATPQAWGEALLGGDPSAIATSGDAVLFEAVFGGLSAALLE